MVVSRQLGCMVMMRMIAPNISVYLPCAKDSAITSYISSFSFYNNCNEDPINIPILQINKVRLREASCPKDT